MYLVTAATDFEMQPFLAARPSGPPPHLVTGVGPVEAAVRLGRVLAESPAGLAGVINFGVAGAYPQPEGDPAPQILDICLAEREHLGDLGVCLEGEIEPFDRALLPVEDVFDLDRGLLDRAAAILEAEHVPCHRGVFVTVNCASGTARRGTMLAARYRALCENMEGAAVARVCREFALPCLELRCVSNMVEDRDTGSWQLKKACRRAAEATALVCDRLAGQSRS